jgi:ATP-dependent Clp protease adapter protein ClpS
MGNTAVEEKVGTITDTDNATSLGKPYNVILFNDENHDMMEVAAQIIKAIHCSPEAALKIMMEAHTTGRAIVITAGLERCELVESILSEIRLGTKIEQA